MHLHNAQHERACMNSHPHQETQQSQSSHVSSCSSVAYVNMIRLDYGNVQRDLVGVG